MKRIYTVHDAVYGPTQVAATLADGSQVMATVEALHVQLVPEIGATIQLPITTPTEADKLLFTEGKQVTVEFSEA